MVITPDIYLNVQSMSTAGVQYDPSHSRQPIFSTNLDHHQWMGSPNRHPTIAIKSEPSDSGPEYGQGQQDRMPLTPPYSVYPATAYREGTPPQVTPPASTPSPKERITPSPKEAACSSSSNSEGEYYESGESLKKLQMALNRSGMITEEKLVCPVCDFFCSVRSQFNEHLLSHETKCSMCEFSGETSEKLKEHMKNVHNCEDDGMWGNEELNTPKVNSQGKVKTFKCKQCAFKAVTKVEFWKHSRVHIKLERLLTCPRCPFVTEYKHHLEYHLRNHFGSKPFKCTECPYTCVNKSMLNSHMKSHSDIYQFGCNNCSYQTKYCHSLKMHLRKYNHTPAMVLNPDGSPNPLPIVDVYGTRRGPRQRPKVAGQQQQMQQQQQQPPLPNIFNPYPMLPAQIPPFFNILSGYAGFPFGHEMSMEERNNNNNIEKDMVRDERAPLDLSRPEPMVEDSSSYQEAPVKSRRKGKAFKLDTIALRLQHRSEEEEEEKRPELQHLHEQSLATESQRSPAQPMASELQQTSPRPAIIERQHSPAQSLVTEFQQSPRRPMLIEPQQSPAQFMVSEPPKSPEVKSCEADSEQKPEKKVVCDSYNCTYCDITFMDIVMYTMHMGYHGYEDPFKCNMCGQQTADKLAFFLHIARTPHL